MVWKKDKNGHWYPEQKEKDNASMVINKLKKQKITLKQALEIEDWLYPLAKWE